MSKLNIDGKLFCPRQDCHGYKKTDAVIIKYGTYTIKSDPESRQMYYCKKGEHQFSETAYSELWRKHGSFKEYEQTCKLACRGLHEAGIADVLGRDVRTIATWIAAAADKSSLFHTWLCTVAGLIIRFLQMDELWSYVNKKDEQHWIFASMDAVGRFWIGFECGKRTTKTANRLARRVYDLGKWDGRRLLRITTDKLKAYQNAIELYFIDIKYVYLQIVKKRVKRVLKTVQKSFVKGTESDFQGKTQNTSYIERFNLTLRQRLCYLARKTLGYCKHPEKFNYYLAINLFSYNYCRMHKSLRTRLPGRPTSKKFVKQYRGDTPAMRMGLVKEPLTWRFLFTVPVP